MKRRKYLVVSLAGLSGCANFGSESETPETTPTSATETTTPSTETPTETTTRTEETPRATPEPQERSPMIQEVNLVSDWEEFGDVEKNAISSATVGETIGIGFIHQTYVDEGTYHVTEQVRVFDNTGSRVGNEIFEDEQIYDVNGYDTFEHALFFNTVGWDAGEYTAEVIIRDEASDEVSNTAETTFSLTEESNSDTRGQRINIGERFSGTLNVGDGTDPRYNDLATPIEFDVEGGTTVVIRLQSADFDPFLILEGPDGSVLGEDDDSGSGINSALTGTLPTDGTYTIWVGSYSGTATGEFTVSVQQAE